MCAKSPAQLRLRRPLCQRGLTDAKATGGGICVFGYAFFKAIEIAQTQQAKSLELRATVSLVRLRQQQAMQHETRTTDHPSGAKLDEAHRMLSEVYNWFTEGFDTKDLQEAKGLLEELSH
ncbi:MAG: hypothetical protein AB7P18_11060 [Candidatus Binatia bacterium]